MINYSFIIPHHNCPDLLYRLLDSIPEREDLEIIVVDDNSKPELRPVISRKSVTLITIGKNESRGAGKARNIGLEKANGKWLLFADSDDHYNENFIDSLDSVLEEFFDIVVFGANKVTKESNGVFVTQKYNLLNWEKYDASCKSITDSKKLAMSTTVPWNKMFRHQFVVENNIRFDEIPIGNDAWFSQFASYKAESIGIVRQPLYTWYYVGNSISTRKRPLKDYMLCHNTTMKINELKYRLGFYELIEIKNVFRKSITANYNIGVFYLSIIYRFLKEPTLLKVLLQKCKQRFHRI